MSLSSEYQATQLAYAVVATAYSPSCPAIIAATGAAVLTNMSSLNTSAANSAGIAVEEAEQIGGRMTGMCLANKMGISSATQTQTFTEYVRLVDAAVNASQGGAIFNQGRSQLLAIPLQELSLLTCEALETALNGVSSTFSNQIAALTTVAQAFLAFKNLMGNVSNSLGTIGTLVGCGEDMLGVVNVYAGSGVMDINTGLDSGIKAYNYASGQTSDPAQIMTIATNRVETYAGYTGRMNTIKSQMASARSILV